MGELSMNPENIANIIKGYIQASGEMKKVVEEMIDVIFDNSTDDDDKQSALCTLLDAIDYWKDK
jgi:hypothetical protein